jgi:hypothetical protein
LPWLNEEESSQEEEEYGRPTTQEDEIRGVCLTSQTCWTIVEGGTKNLEK